MAQVVDSANLGRSRFGVFRMGLGVSSSFIPPTPGGAEDEDGGSWWWQPAGDLLQIPGPLDDLFSH